GGRGPRRRRWCGAAPRAPGGGGAARREQAHGEGRGEAVPDVREGLPPGGRVLRVRLPGRQGADGTRPPRRLVRGRWAALRRLRRRRVLPVLRGVLDPGQVRDAGGGRLLLGAPGRGRRRALPVRLAEGPLGPLLAGEAPAEIGRAHV